MPRTRRTRGRISGHGASNRGTTGGCGRAAQTAPYSLQRSGRSHPAPPPPTTSNQAAANPPASPADQALKGPPPDTSLNAASSAAAQQVSQLSMAEFLETIRHVVREERTTTPPVIQDSTGDGDTHAAPTSVPPPMSQSSLPPVAVSPSLPLTSTHLPAAQGSGGPTPTSGTFTTPAYP